MPPLLCITSGTKRQVSNQQQKCKAEEVGLVLSFSKFKVLADVLFVTREACRPTGAVRCVNCSSPTADYRSISLFKIG
ncbi:hypothetical protein CEXT_549361 [Caerostris extrusa]|uniref:Uncharacterized protein n=1 Tax=Caerostris extrusa TaxID=172846 RepID=A0AAV4ML64_CAEEX|nr:hypothetical protein CEXT_549361 [Caerostris extrusa]